MGVRLTPDWMDDLPLQQQSVLLLATRGPDGVRKHHPCKPLIRAYRACLMKAASLGRLLRSSDEQDTFADATPLRDRAMWDGAVRGFFMSVDELPHHYYLHFLHGAQIMGHRHPDPVIGGLWLGVYEEGCRDMHVTPETREELDARLGDFGRHIDYVAD